MRAAWRLAATAAAVAWFGGAAAALADEGGAAEAAIAADSECEVGAAGEGSAACAASWLQLRAARERLAGIALASAGGKANASAGARGRRDCPTDTGGSCVVFGCAESRGGAECVRRRCRCKPGFCNDNGVCRSEEEGEDAPREDPDLEGVCVADTGGTCAMSGCYAFRGADCSSKRCVCKPGSCSVLGVCHTDMGNVKATVVPVNQDSPVFPAAQGHVSAALVLSGGGTRSQVVSLGVLRALEALGLMPKVDAISSVSGGTWAAAIYVFADKGTEELLGPATVPSELTMEVLERAPAAMGATAATGTTKIAARLLWEGVPSHHLWVYTIGEAILAPFGLSGKDSYMAPDQQAVARIKRENPQLQDADFLVPAKGRPRTLVMSGAILAPMGYKAESSNVVSLQISPDFTGSPFYPDNGTVDYDSQHRRFNQALVQKVIGGGLVETFAFGGQPPAGATVGAGPGGAVVMMGAPPEPLSLAKAVGVSSAGPASALTQVGTHGALNVASLNPRVNIWPVLAKRFGLPGQRATTYNLGDGGNIDNSGLLAMLQRKASRIIWLVNTGAALPETEALCDAGYSLEAKVAAAVDSQVTDKFGYWRQDDLGEFLTHNQVFREQDLPPVLCDLAKLRDAGKPAVALERLEVRRNDWWGITGGFEVDILFVYNALCQDFVSQLPGDTRQQLDLGARGAFNRFPHYWPVMQNLGEATALTASQVNLLAAHAEYVTLQSAPLFRKILG